jgi:hypothetical protein
MDFEYIIKEADSVPPTKLNIALIGKAGGASGSTDGAGYLIV